MTWDCEQCTYTNINDNATRCHACSASRKGGVGIVDLTKLSPKTNNGGASNKTILNGGSNKRGTDMESNRSRRRRREESAKSKGESSESTLKQDESNSTIDLTNSNTKKKDRKSSTGGGSIASSRKRERVKDDSDDDDIIVDPAPRKKVPLNKNDNTNSNKKMSSSIEVKQKKEPKLKKKKKKRTVIDDNVNSGDDEANYNNSSKPSSSSASGSESRLTDFYNQQKRPHISAESLMERANSILQQTFKHNSLRPLQETAVKNALQQKSSIVIMATGGGKSICYQLPALVGSGINDNTKLRAENSSVTICVCPLIALMMDQVSNLHRLGVRTAACLRKVRVCIVLSANSSSSQSAKTKQEILNRLNADGGKQKVTKKSQQANTKTPIQLLYVTPELIETERFRTILTNLYRSNRLHMFAIDEAHCLSSWGHDFRPAYRKLTWIRTAFPNVPIMALTGTATSKVVLDIREILQLDKSVPCVMGSFNRSNISYEVRFKDSLNATNGGEGAISDLISVVKDQHQRHQNQPCSGIVYVHKRDDCHSLAKQISKATGLNCLPYHAGLKDAERDSTQRKWTSGECKIAVATVAFGMGIDLPHVRYVIHWTMAKSLDGFYQESGRGGRDGKPAISVLYYSKEDAEKFSWLLKMNAEKAAKKKGKNTSSQAVDHSIVELEGMVNYCTQPKCKRKFVLDHFGEQIDASVVCNKTCDFCINPKKVERDIQAAECMSSVVNSHRLISAGNKHRNEGKKYHHNPLDDEESLDDNAYGSEDDFFGGDSGLGITDCARADEMPAPLPKKGGGGFVKASSVLNKYEKLECQGQGGKANGFINFKKRTFDEPTQDDIDAKKKRATVNVPEHLRRNLPDPFAAFKKAGKEKKVAKSSSTYASESERMKAELEELKKQRAEALAKMSSSSKSSFKKY